MATRRTLAEPQLLTCVKSEDFNYVPVFSVERPNNTRVMIIHTMLFNALYYSWKNSPCQPITKLYGNTPFGCLVTDESFEKMAARTAIFEICGIKLVWSEVGFFLCVCQNNDAATAGQKKNTKGSLQCKHRLQVDNRRSDTHPVVRPVMCPSVLWATGTSFQSGTNNLCEQIHTSESK